MTIADDETAFGPGARSAPASRRSAGLARWWPLGAAAVLLAWLWLGPLPAMSRIAFSPHMILHLGLVGVVAPLLAFGLIRVGLLPHRGVTVGWAVAASLLEFVVVWGWHTPGLHELAARQPVYFVVQQVSFLLAGLAVWGVGFADRSRAAAGAGLLAMLTTFMHMTMLGILLTLAREPLYAADICRGAFGFDPLEDQQFGGVLMTVAGGLPYLCGGAVLAWRLVADRSETEA